LIRQARTYLLGAMSGTALIAVAVVAFVVLVSAQAFKNWPLADLGGGSDSAKTAQGRSAEEASATGASPTAATTAALTADRSGGSRSPVEARHSGTLVSQEAVGAADVGAGPGIADTGSPGGSSPVEGTSTPAVKEEGSSGSDAPSAGSSPGSSSGGGSSGKSSGSGGSSPSSGSVSAGVVNTVNNTVSGVNKTVGGTLESTGVTKTTEEVVNGVAGPESVVGQTVDKTVETVSGLLSPHH